MQWNNVENRAKEVDRLRSQLSREETAATALRSEASEARKGSHVMPVSNGIAEEQAELMKKNMSWIESMAQVNAACQ